MKVLVLGGSGLLGHKLVQVFKSRFEVSATFHGNFEKYSGLDIFDGVKIIENFKAENIESKTKVIIDVEPDVIVNAIGITKHVPAGDDLIKTLSINSIFPHRLAKIATEINSRLICISTDCVFSGEKGNYVETDAADAMDLYGKSKSLGEVVEGNCLTIRTSIIGRELFTRNSLVEWFLSNRGGRVKGFTKAIFTGFPTIILAEIIADIIEKHSSLRGLYHVSSDKISKFDLLQLINDAMNVGAEIEADNELAIDRSLDSTKFRNEAGFVPNNWPEMIKQMVDDARIYETLTK
jgi:dTDP-4-dehydrorhamnose reductase